MVRTEYMTMFEQCGTDTATLLVQAKRGLGNQFKAAVVQLLKECSKSSTPEVVAAYDIALEAMEGKANEVLLEAFGEFDDDGKKHTLSRHMPAFRQYKSKYRALLKKLGAEAGSLPDLGMGAVNKKLAELSKPTAKDDDAANKGPESGASGDAGGEGSTDTGSASGKKHKPLTPEVQKHLDNFAAALANMDEAEALSIVQKSEAIAWGALKLAGGGR